MAQYASDQAEIEAIRAVAGMMVVAARTAPKSQGIDDLQTLIVDGTDIEDLATLMEQMEGEKLAHPRSFTNAAYLIRNSVCVVLMGIMGSRREVEGSHDCGACGYKTCAAMKKIGRRQGNSFIGPVCISKSLDLGIAIGSAVKQAGMMNVDNRIYYTIGAAAKRMNLLESDVIIGIPLSATGKNIYFDMQALRNRNSAASSD